MLSVIAQANVLSWPKRLYGWYGDCKIGDSWCSRHVNTIWPSLGWSCFQSVERISQVLGFLKRCKKYFTLSDLRTIYVIYIRPKMEYNSHLWAGASKSALDLVHRVQSRALKLIGDDRVASSITSLGHHRNVSCIVLFCKYYFGKCSSELSEYHRPRYSQGLPDCPHEGTLSLLRPCPSAQHIIGKTHSLHVLSACWTTKSFLNASIFQCLKQR